MISKIAWRNIWRNPLRSVVLVTTIIIGIVGFWLMMAFSRGLVDSMIDSIINLHAGHVQISSDGYYQDPSTDRYLTRPQQEQVQTQLSMLKTKKGKTRVAHSAPIVSVQGMVSSSETSLGVMIHGVQPDQERQVTEIADRIVEGKYLNSGQNVVIGKRLADQLKVEVSDKIVLITNSLNGEINSGAFRVGGIYRVGNSDFEKSFVYLTITEAQQLAGYQDQQITAISVQLSNDKYLAEVVQELRKNLPADGGYGTVSWKDQNPIGKTYEESMSMSSGIIIGITFVAVALGLLNIFLMVIYERIHEFGVMMANGIRPSKIRQMLVLEGLFLGLIGTACGTVISVAVIGHFAYHGLDLSAFSEGLSTFGVGSVIKFTLSITDFLTVIICVQGVAVLSALYPAIKASRFKVVDAINFE